ncbi:unnamed protein product [Camellia sinensis]
MNKSFKIFVYPTLKSHPFANGPIPSFIGDLPNLEVLQIWENNFTLELPANLGRNGKLLRLNVATNHLTGTIPRDMCEGGRLETLILMENYFVGSILEELGECKSLNRVRLVKNFFSGTIPAGFFNMPFLEMIESHLVIPLGISISFDIYGRSMLLLLYHAEIVADERDDCINYEDTTEKLRSWTKEVLVHHQTSTDAASNDDGDNDKYDTSKENGDSSAKVKEEPKCHEVAHNSDHSSNKESNGAMVKREFEVVVVAQA